MVSKSGVNIIGGLAIWLIIFSAVILGILSLVNSRYGFVIINQNNMRLTSSAFENNSLIPAKYTCDGENISPPLSISGAPSEAKDLVLIVDDPDAPKSTWVHWTVWNIDPATDEIKEGSIPKDAREGLTSFDEVGYGGPCPPSGTHRYRFKLFALNEPIRFTTPVKLYELEAMMDGKIIDKAELIGLYGRK